MTEPFLEIKDLTVAYGENVIMHDVSFTVNTEDVFIIMGGSGCGKSTLLTVLTGLKRPVKGTEVFAGKRFGETAPRKTTATCPCAKPVSCIKAARCGHL